MADQAKKRTSVRERVFERFQEDTAGHGMNILRDDDLYRHIRFNAPGTYIYGFDLVTWPGYLAIVGDAGDYLFSRIRDMFEFFESDHGGINPHYWAEKLQGPGHDMARSYSHDKLREVVLAWGADQCEFATAWDWSEYAVYPALMEEALEREILSGWTHGEMEGRERLEALEEEVGYQLETWEWDLREYDHRFLWCCHAIVWGISAYRDAVSKPPIKEQT